MDRAENIKKYLDQEKEGKETIVENVSISCCDKAHYTSVSGSALWSTVRSGPFIPRGLEIYFLLCISAALHISCS